MTIQRLVTLGLAMILMLVGSCAGSDGKGADRGAGGDSVGTVSVALQVAPGVDLSAINFLITNPALLPSERSGTVDVAMSEAVKFVVGGLPSGDGYRLTLTGTTATGFPCASDPAAFSIVAGETTVASVGVVCTPPRGSTVADSGSLAVDATVTLGEAGPPCPAVDSLTALPTEVDIGGMAQLSATATGADAILQWSATGSAGSLASPTGATNVLTCAGAGPVTVTVSATTGDATCHNSASVQVNCDFAPCPLPPSLPFSETAQLSGTANLHELPNGRRCSFRGPGGPTRGSVSFVMTSTTCSFIYTDESGTQYVSNFPSGPVTADGDNFTCSVDATAPLTAGELEPCSELSPNGAEFVVVSLSVTRSTGAVSLQRLCDEGCATTSSLFSLNGAVTCSDGG